MEVPFIDFQKVYQNRRESLLASIDDCLSKGWYVLGPAVEKLEAELGKMSEIKSPFVSCNSGTDALILSLKAAGVSTDDEVICVSHTAIPSISAIRAVGAVPVFCEIDPETWLMSLDDLEQLIGPKTKAVFAVHLYGNMVDIPALYRKLERLGRTDIVVIEDCAQSQGSRLNDAYAGSLGDFGAFSFYPTKNLGALGDGGAISSKHPEMIDRLKLLRNYGQKSRYQAEIDLGINSRLDELQASILMNQLEFFSSDASYKLKLTNSYKERLKNLPLKLQKETWNCKPNWHLFVVQLENMNVRDNLLKHLSENKVQCLIHYPTPNHKQKAFFKYAQRELPITEELANTILSLPMNPAISSEQQGKVVDSLNSFFGNRN